MVQVKDFKDGKKVRIGDSFAAHGTERIRVDDLLAKRTGGEIGSLRNVEHLSKRGLADGAAIDWPKPTENTEE